MPTSLTGIRVTVSWEVLQVDGTTESDDALGAYLNAPLPGGPYFRKLPWDLLQELAPHCLHMKCPVAQIDQALYGLPRSDTEWGLEARRRLKGVAFHYVAEIGEDSIHLPYDKDRARYLLPTFTIVYTDDIATSGERIRTQKEQALVRSVLGIDKSAGCSLLDYVGFERLPLGYPAPGVNVVALYQCSSLRSVVEDCERDHCSGATLRSVSTPGMTGNPKDEEVPVWVPQLGHVAAHVVMQVFWVARGTRPSLMQTCKRLSGRFTQWTRADDWILHRMMQYCRGHLHYGILLVGCHVELKRLRLNL